MFQEKTPASSDVEGKEIPEADTGYWYTFIPECKVGDQYLFAVKIGDEYANRIDPYARQVTNSVGHAVVADPEFHWQDDDFQLPPKNELVIYELHIGTFGKDACEDQPGTLSAATRQLDYLKRIGVNCIEVMPVAEFAGDFSWGYNPAHIFAVESSYGGPKALKKFVREAHKRGIGVIMDVVYNHFGPSDLHLWQFDGWSENDLGGIYFYNDWRAETPWGKTRPDYGRPEVRQFIRDNALMWLEEFHCDGLRFDMTLYIRSVRGDGDPGADLPDGWSLAQWINTEVKEQFPNAVTIAEDLHDSNAITNKPEHGGAGFSAQWDSQFVHPVRDVLIQQHDSDRSLDAIKNTLFVNYNGDPFERVIYTESHDEVANGKARIPSEVMPHETRDWFAQKRSMLGLALVMTTPGVPMVFQGQEFLEDGWFRDTVPLDWDKAKELRGLVRLFHDLSLLRLNRSETSRGLTGSGVEILHEHHEEKTIAFLRTHSRGTSDNVVVIMNFHRDPRTVHLKFPAQGKWTLALNSDSSLYSDEFANTPAPHELTIENDDTHPVEIGPYSALIYLHTAE